MPAPKPENEKRERRVLLLMTETEYYALHDKAMLCGEHVSEMIRWYMTKGGFDGFER